MKREGLYCLCNLLSRLIVLIQTFTFIDISLNISSPALTTESAVPIFAFRSQRRTVVQSGIFTLVYVYKRMNIMVILKKKDYSAHIFLYCLVGTYNFNDVLTSAVILHFLITLSTFTLKTSLSVMTYFVCATNASIRATFVDILIAIGPCPTWHADTAPYGVTPVHPGPALTHSTTPLSVIWSNTFYKYNAPKFTILNT